MTPLRNYHVSGSAAVSSIGEFNLLFYRDAGIVAAPSISQETPLDESSSLLSVIVPCRNEKRHIEQCIASILDQQEPLGGIEVIVADGMSDDGTREILQRMAKANRRVRLIDNPAQTTPSAMNAGIRAARGRYVAILGAHTEYAADYLRSCLELLDEHPEVCCAGGPITSRGVGTFGQAVAAAMSHPVGIGNARHRHPWHEGYAEGACFPVFRREVFDRVGLYDESLIRNQDDELNYRLALSDEKVFISPRARCTYYVRETPRELFAQYFQYGLWRVAVLRKHRVPASLRQIAPAAFFGALAVTLVGGLSLPGWYKVMAGALPLAYAIGLTAAGIGVARTRGPHVGAMFPLAAITMHVAYAVGFGWGCLGRERGGARATRARAAA